MTRRFAPLPRCWKRAAPRPGARVISRSVLGGSVLGSYLLACGSPEAKALAEEIRQAVMEPELYLEPITVSIRVVNLYEFFLADGTTEEIALQIEQTALHRLSIGDHQGTSTNCDTSEPVAAAASARPAVLVVEPDPVSIELLLHALKTAGFAVEVRQDGESALALVQVSPPAVIPCEAMVPRLDGFSVRERLRANAESPSRSCATTLPTAGPRCRKPFACSPGSVTAGSGVCWTS